MEACVTGGRNDAFSDFLCLLRDRGSGLFCHDESLSTDGGLSTDTLVANRSGSSVRIFVASAGVACDMVPISWILQPKFQFERFKRYAGFNGTS